MHHARFRTENAALTAESGPHFVTAIYRSLIWANVCRLFVTQLARAGIAVMLTLSIHCGSAYATAADTAPVAVSDPYAGFVAEASQRFGLPTSWLRAVMQVESAGNPKAVSPKGAMGLMQLMPDTWSMLRVQYHFGSDPFDPHDNILGGAAYLRKLFDRFGASGFLAAYNAGPKRFEDYRAGLRPLRDETRRYVSTLAQMLPDLQLGGALPAVVVVTDWRASGLFARPPITPSSSTNAPNGVASKNTTMAKSFSLGPQSDGLFVPVLMPDQR